uniref:Strictosidine synthase conserved region domain-containing protein n=1 Tax=Vitis vinifera TaxID=29760 RepID=A5AHV2_VITVI|nr:hypothetical protein VITISV_044020 [Vitis vinifera]
MASSLLVPTVEEPPNLPLKAEGVPFRFLNAVDVDQETGIVYFTDASARFQRREFQNAVLAGDMTGRLMKYDPRTKQVTVLLRGLGLAVGVAINKDGSFVLVSEFIATRIQRYWLRGPKANTSELFLKPTGTPDNIKRNARRRVLGGCEYRSRNGCSCAFGA